MNVIKHNTEAGEEETLAITIQSKSIHPTSLQQSKKDERSKHPPTNEHPQLSHPIRKNKIDKTKY